ncbi:hypothetical protein [Bosea sp. 2RAB26]|uniref:hypothetical protein n=1 Tax=Bosea sp. 2RAB26 TaxID=3237476 RepID=UPI003F8E3BE3
MATPAQAACTPGAVDATTPAPGTTVTCTGNTVNQNVDAGYGTGNQTGITINVGDGASVESVGRIGIWVGDAVIRNGLGASVLGRTNGIDAATGSLAVTNYGSITGTNGVGISASAGAASVINSGTISSTNGTGITASSNVTLTNQAGGAVRGAVDGVVSTAGAITVDNAGNITGTNAAAIDALTDITVTNRAGGVISGGTRGIFSRGGNITIDNAGSITSTGGVATVSAGFDSVKLINRAGASIGGSVVAFKAVDVENAGDIGGIFGQNVRVVNTATGTIGSIASIAGADIVNFGNMTDVRTSGTLVNHAGGNIGILLGMGGLSVTNSGTMGGWGTASATCNLSTMWEPASATRRLRLRQTAHTLRRSSTQAPSAAASLRCISRAAATRSRWRQPPSSPGWSWPWSLATRCSSVAPEPAASISQRSSRGSQTSILVSRPSTRSIARCGR